MFASGRSCAIWFIVWGSVVDGIRRGRSKSAAWPDAIIRRATGY